MSVSRKVLAEVSEVPEEYVKCKTCSAYNSKREECLCWELPITDKEKDFCSFWAERGEYERQAVL